MVFFFCCDNFCYFHLAELVTLKGAMTDSSKKFESGLTVKTQRMSDMESIAEAMLDKQHGYMETHFNKLQQMGEGMEEKLQAILTD